MDTMGGDDVSDEVDEYGAQQFRDGADDSEGSGQNNKDHDKLSVNLDDLDDEQEDSDDAIDLVKGGKGDLSSLAYSQGSS